jgi:UDP-2,3-diacylglucosamine pyrophosphatase LpxH
MQLIRHNPASLTLEVPSASGQRLSLMLASDVHFDSVVCDLDLFTKHLRLAEELQAPVLICGDLLDAMQGKWDPRRQPEDLKDQYKVSAYYDAIVMDCAKFLSKFDIPAFILGLGNHETSVLSHSNTDLLGNVAYQLRVEHGKQAVAAGYWGYLRVMFRYKKGNGAASKTIYWHHGSGGAAPVSHGLIQANRQGVWIRDADIVVNGHNHKNYTYAHPTEKLNQITMQPYNDIIWYLRTPGYKKSSGESMTTWGFEAEKLREPTSKGCIFLTMEYNKANETVATDVMQKII